MTMDVNERSATRTRLLLLCLGLVLVTILARLGPALVLENEVSDIPTYREMANVVMRGDNIYAPRIFFPYTPYSQFIPYACLRLADLTGWRFDLTIKLPSIASDAIVTILLFYHLMRRSRRTRTAMLWTLAWALNPVSILVTAFHANLMSVVAGLMFGAFVAADASRESPNRDLLLAISALTLGLAIAMRSFPVFLVPACLALAVGTLRRSVVFTGLAAAPAVLSLIPYHILVPHPLWREVRPYSGSIDLSWVSVIRSVDCFLHGGLGFTDDEILGRTRLLFLASAVLTYFALPWMRRSALGRAMLLPPLLFLGLYGGVAAQYLVWGVPIALALTERRALAFSAAATGALVTFYWQYHPGILFGRFGEPFPATRTIFAAAAVFKALVVAICLWWIVVILVAECAPRLRRATPSALFEWLTPTWMRGAYLAVVILAGSGWLILLARSLDRAVQLWGAFAR